MSKLIQIVGAVGAVDLVETASVRDRNSMCRSSNAVEISNGCFERQSQALSCWILYKLTEVSRLKDQCVLMSSYLLMLGFYSAHS